MKYCLNCGKECYNKYCCNDCQLEYQWKVKKEEIERTGHFINGEINDQKARRTARRYLKEKYGNKCSICGITEWNGKDITLIVDHIDGDITNTNIDNFRLICPNCDSQLPTFKFRNKGKCKRIYKKGLKHPHMIGIKLEV